MASQSGNCCRTCHTHSLQCWMLHQVSGHPELHWCRLFLQHTTVSHIRTSTYWFAMNLQRTNTCTCRKCCTAKHNITFIIRYAKRTPAVLWLTHYMWPSYPNTLWPNDLIKGHSTCPIISVILWHLHEGNCMDMLMVPILDMSVQLSNLRSPRDQPFS